MIKFFSTKIVFLLALVFTLQTQAQLGKAYQKVKKVIVGSASLAQLHYFPESLEVNLTAGYRFTSIDFIGKSAGTTSAEVNAKQNTLQSVFKLGLFDNVYTQLSVKYLVDSSVNYTKPKTLSDTKSTGVIDPVITAVVRAVDNSIVKLDGKIGFQPSLGDRNIADANSDGDAKSGGYAVIIGGRVIGLITESSQVLADVEYSLFGARNSINQATKEVTESEKHNQLIVGIATMTELTSKIYFGLLFEMQNVDGYQTTDLNSNIKNDFGVNSSKALNLVGKYLFTPDSLVELQAGYLIDNSQKTNTTEFKSTGYSTSVDFTVRF